MNNFDFGITIITDLKEATVEKEKLIIRNVSILGSESRDLNNKLRKHYTETCLRNSVNIFEGAPAYMDHQPRARRHDPRSVRDLFGHYRNVHFDSGKVRGDLDMYDTPDAHHVMSIAEKNPEAVGNSIAAAGRGRKEGNIIIVEEIFPRNMWGYKSSVDLVDDPATTKSLFEERTEENPDNKENAMEWKDLTISGLKANRIDLYEELMKEGSKTRDTEVTTLSESVKKVEGERDGLKSKVDLFEVKDAMASKTIIIDELLEKSTLPKEAKTDVFRNQLLALEERKDGANTVTIENQAKALIEDREKAIKGKAGVKNAGGERHIDITEHSSDVPKKHSEVLAELRG